jgi:hypothetical protein
LPTSWTWSDAIAPNGDKDVVLWADEDNLDLLHVSINGTPYDLNLAGRAARVTCRISIREGNDRIVCYDGGAAGLFKTFQTRNQALD